MIDKRNAINLTNNRFLATTPDLTSTSFGKFIENPPAMTLEEPTISSPIDSVQDEPIDLSFKSLEN